MEAFGFSGDDYGMAKDRMELNLTLEPPSSVPVEESGSSSAKSNNCVTLQPFEPLLQTKSRRPNDRKQKTNKVLLHFESIFQQETWARYLLLKVKSGSLKFSEMLCVLMTTYSTQELSFRQVSFDEWIIEATTKDQSNAFMNIK